MEIKYCPNCEALRLIDKAELLLERETEFTALWKKREQMLDDGMSHVDCAIHFKNMLWRMGEEGVSWDSPKRMALENLVAMMDAAVAHGNYKEAGWHLKHSGEWVKNKE